MGPVTDRLTRMGFLLCVDAVPAFNHNQKGAVSLLLAEFINMSLAPHVRYNPDHMMPWLLIPDNMGADTQLKFFNYVIKNELNPLSVGGVPGPDGPVLCKLFGASLDLKGKEKFWNQITVQGYCGCSVCTIHYDQGPRCVIYAAARRWLPADHPLRNQSPVFQGHQFFFRGAELRAAPANKTTQSVLTCATITIQRELTHYLGQKGYPMLSSLEGFKYSKLNILEWMHNLARAHECFMSLLVGGDAKLDDKMRRTSADLGLFPSIWPNQVQFLSEARTRLLRGLQDDTIQSADSVWLRRWLRICSVIPEARTRVQELRDRLTSLRDMTVRGERVPLVGVVQPLPWRLTPEAKVVVNRRVAGIIYPHYTPTCSKGQDSFINRTGCWRTASKLVALCVILVPALRGYVTKFRTGLSSLIHGLRILEGQPLSVNEAKALGLEPGSKALEKAAIDFAKTLIIEGMSMIEGCCPICVLAPALHCLCHYAEGTSLHGILKLLWMMSCERFNKKCKNLTANKQLPFMSLANSLVRDATAYFHRWMLGKETLKAAPATTVIINRSCYSPRPNHILWDDIHIRTHP